MNERRAAVRLLQPSCLEQDATVPSGAEISSPSSPRGGAQPFPSPNLSLLTSSPRPVTGRRRSTCLPPSAADELAAEDLTDGGSRLGGTSSSGGEQSPHHLSVPLTLLSLNNGGGRHTPRAGSRDTSPLIVMGGASREGSFSSLPDGIVLGGSIGGSGSRAGAFTSPSRRASVVGAPPQGLSSPSNSGPLPTLSASMPRDFVPTTRRPPRGELRSSGGGADAQSPSGSALSTSAPIGAASTVAASSGGATSGAGSTSLPAHLCSQRPPTPLCKEEDLMAPMRHLASPTRRRSRFASAADPSFLAAAAAAIAAEEAGLLDSPMPSFTAGSPGIGGARTACEPPVLRPLAISGTEPAPWGATSPSASRRSCSQLVTVFEEPSAGGSGSSGTVTLAGGGGSAAMVTPRIGLSAPGSGAGPAPPSPGPGRRRGAGSSTNTDIGVRPQDGDSGHSGPLAIGSGGGGIGGSAGAGAGGGGAALASGGAAPVDDSLSSFMCNFGPGAPGTGRRSISTPLSGPAAPAAGAISNILTR